MEEERKRKRKGGMCDKVTKSAPTERAGILYKEKGTERRKKVEKGRGRRDSIYGQAMRSTVRIEEEFSRRVKEKDSGTLWKRHPRRGAIIRIGIVYKGNDKSIKGMGRKYHK